MKPEAGQSRGIRAVYIIPRGQHEWTEAQTGIQSVLARLQKYFASELGRQGFGARTFNLACRQCGSMVLDVVRTPREVSDFRSSAWQACKQVGKKHGLRSRHYSDTVIYVHEGYTIDEGKVAGAGARGACANGRSEVFLSSLHLKLADEDWLGSDESYCGRSFPWISDAPLGRHTLNWRPGWGETLGDIAGKSFGVVAHELGHAFGASHPDKNDPNWNTYLMGAGFQGMRQYFIHGTGAGACELSPCNAAKLASSDLFQK